MWDDPWCIMEAWVLPEDIKTHVPEPHKTAGYIVPPKQHGMGVKWLVLAGTVSGTGHYGDVNVIPKAVVRTITDLKKN